MERGEHSVKARGIHRRHHSYQRGVTLIELMIATLLGAFLIFGMMQAMLSGRLAYGLQLSLSRIQESGRFALEMLNYDIHRSGDYGCGVGDAFLTTGFPADDITSPACTGINGLQNADDIRYNYNFVVYGYDNVDAGTIATLSYIQPAPIQGSDILLVRPVQDAGILTVATTGTDRTNLTVANRAGLSGPTISSNDVIALSDCAHARIFQVENVVAGAAGASTVALAGAGSAAIPGNRCDLNGLVFDSASVIKELDTVFYYVGLNAANIPSLYSYSVSKNASSELVEGVENMQLMFGIDLQAAGTAGFGVVDSYLTPSAVNANAWSGWDKDANIVRSVRFSLLIRGEIPVLDSSQTYKFPPENATATTASDLRLRQVFTSIAGVRVRSNPN